jgi:iron complex outermembrane receptor protein
LNKSLLEQKIKKETIDKYSNQTLGDILTEIAGVSSLKTGSSVVKPVINGLFEQSSGDQQQCSFRRSRMGNGACINFDVNAAGKSQSLKALPTTVWW